MRYWRPRVVGGWSGWHGDRAAFARFSDSEYGEIRRLKGLVTVICGKLNLMDSCANNFLLQKTPKGCISCAVDAKHKHFRICFIVQTGLFRHAESPDLGHILGIRAWSLHFPALGLLSMVFCGG